MDLGSGGIGGAPHPRELGAGGNGGTEIRARSRPIRSPAAAPQSDLGELPGTSAPAEVRHARPGLARGSALRCARRQGDGR